MQTLDAFSPSLFLFIFPLQAGADFIGYHRSPAAFAAICFPARATGAGRLFHAKGSAAASM